MNVWTEEQMEAAVACDCVKAYADRMRRATDVPTRRMHATTVIMRIEGLRLRYGAGADGMMARYSEAWLGGKIVLEDLEREAREAADGAGPRAYGPGRRDWAHDAMAACE